MALDLTSGIGNIAIRILNIVASIGALLGGSIGAYFLWKLKQYRYTCWIYNKRAEGKFEIQIAKGGFFKLDQDTWTFRLRGQPKIHIKPPANKFIHRAKRKDIIHFRKIGENQFIPFNPTFSEKAEDEYIMNVNYDENISWYLSVVDLIRKHLDWRSFLDKYGQIFVTIIVVFMVIVVVYMTYEFATGGTNAISGLSGTIERFMASQTANPVSPTGPG